MPIHALLPSPQSRGTFDEADECATRSRYVPDAMNVVLAVFVDVVIEQEAIMPDFQAIAGDVGGYQR